MRTIRREIEIDAGPARVWEILTDLGSYSRWNPFMTRASGDLSPGGRLLVHITPPEARAMTFRPTVLAVEPQRELRWLGHLILPGLFDGEHRLALEPLGQDRTRFVQEETFQGILVSRLCKVLDRTEEGFGAMNEALKRRAEAGPPAPAA